MNTNQYLNKVQQRLDISSDYALAIRLCVTRQAVSNWRHGKTFPDTLSLYRIADILELSPSVVVAHIELEKAQKYANENHANAWSSILQKGSGIAATIVLGTVLSAPSPASSTMKTAQNGADPVCIM